MLVPVIAAVRVVHAGIGVHAEHEIEAVGAARRAAVAFALLAGRGNAVAADVRGPRAEHLRPPVRAAFERGDGRVARAVAAGGDGDHLLRVADARELVHEQRRGRGGGRWRRRGGRRCGRLGRGGGRRCGVVVVRDRRRCDGASWSWRGRGGRRRARSRRGDGARVVRAAAAGRRRRSRARATGTRRDRGIEVIASAHSLRRRAPNLGRCVALLVGVPSSAGAASSSSPSHDPRRLPRRRPRPRRRRRCRPPRRPPRPRASPPIDTAPRGRIPIATTTPAAPRAAPAFTGTVVDGDRSRPPVVVSRRLPGRSRPVARAAPVVLGLRRPTAHRHADRERERGRRGAARCSRSSTRERFPIRQHATGRRVRRERPRVDGGRQHVGVQLPQRGRDRARRVVGARVRRGHRREHGREPVRRGRRRAARPRARRSSTGRYTARAWRSPVARSSTRSPRSDGSGVGAGRIPTTNTSRRPAADAAAPRIR